MSKVVVVAVVVGVLGASAASGDDRPAVPADFKLLVGSFALKPEPVSTEEVIVRQGRAYLFASDTKEVVVIEPAGKRLELIDVGRKLKAEITFGLLDGAIEDTRARLRQSVEDREKTGGRGNLLEARMTRDLFETKMVVAEGPGGSHLRLTNPAVEVGADGEPEADAPRLASVATILATVARLGNLRAPTDLPPFAELATIAELTGPRKLRPTELTYLYRLNGPPRKFRRTYRLVPSLTGREIEATARVDRFRDAIPEVRYGKYKSSR